MKLLSTRTGGAAKGRSERVRNGLRGRRIWLPDLNDPELRARIAADLQVMRGHPSIADGNQFADAALADMDDWRA